jgi:hypothetical protein
LEVASEEFIKKTAEMDKRIRNIVNKGCEQILQKEKQIQ